MRIYVDSTQAGFARILTEKGDAFLIPERFLILSGATSVTEGIWLQCSVDEDGKKTRQEEQEILDLRTSLLNRSQDNS